MDFKILLIAVFNDPSETTFEEIGICSIASVLRKNGYRVLLIGAAESAVNYEKITEFNPGIIGVTVYNHTKDSVYKFCRKIQNKLPDTLICAGGYLPSYQGVEMMEEANFIDFVIRGEGEFAFLELVSHLENKGEGKKLESIEGLIFRKDDKIVVNRDRPLITDLNSLPFPARDILVDNKLKLASLESSRGCTHNCAFCTSPNFWKKWRGKDIGNLQEELKYLYNLGIRQFNFIDNSFEDPDRHHERIMKLTRGIKDLNLDISYFVDIRAGFHRKADDRLMTLLKESGLSGVIVGVETGNEFDRKLYGKGASLEDHGKTLELLRKHRIGINIGFINFNPYSTFAGLNKNIDFLEKYGFASNFGFISSRYMLLKGTRLYDKIERDNLIKEGIYNDRFRYNYIDKRIMYLANYINNYLELKSQETNGAPKKINLYGYFYLILLLNYQSKFGKANLSKAGEILQEHEKKVKKMLDELNKRNARWFRELLSLAEESWNNHKAEAIMKNSLSTEYIKQTLKQLDQEKYEFLFKIMSLGPAYEELLSS